jgi:hypothetical protein
MPCTVPAACLAGTFLAGVCSGASAPPSNPTCAPCLQGSYQMNAGQTACIPASVCDSNQYEAQPPTATSNRQCIPCASQSTCQPGQFVQRACPGSAPPESDLLCAPCANGTFSSVAGQTSCTAFAVCAEDQYAVSLGTATSNTVCQNCTPASSCVPGTRLAGTCSGFSIPATNTACQACDALSGAFQDEVCVCVCVRVCSVSCIEATI